MGAATGGHSSTEIGRSFWVLMSSQFPLASHIYVKLESQCGPGPCDFSFSIISKLWKHFTFES